MRTLARGRHFFLIVWLPLLAACGPPVGVVRVSPSVVHQELTANVLSAGVPSAASRNVLGQYNLEEEFQARPAQALAALHDLYVQGGGGLDEAFTLAELSFLHAQNSGRRLFYLAAALYAYAYLFPDAAEREPGRFDRRLRVAADLYNRGLTEGLKSADGTVVELRSGVYDLPFGQLEVTFEERQRLWAGRRLEHFVPVADLQVHGLQNRYRISGIGAPLAADQVPVREQAGFQVGARLKVPATALLRVGDPRRQLARGRVYAVLELHVALDDSHVQINGRQVPLETETSAFLAYTLHESPVWKREIRGFLRGGLKEEFPFQLAGLEPYREGRFPVVLVHGTASSVGRWAEMVNELFNDERIRRRFQFWFFGYDSGNPVVYSAMQLRDALTATIAQVDPEHHDAALEQMVIIGHSQGGLLAKMTVVDSGDRLWNAFSRKPLEEMDIPEDRKALLERVAFFEPLPFVRRVVFIATPHRGSFAASGWLARTVAGLVSLPGTVIDTVGDLLTREAEALTLDADKFKTGSIFGMTPGNPVLDALAETPIDSRVEAHSIIAVKGLGPVDVGDDGIVTYKSAHLEGVASELIVRSGHSTQSHPATIEEVRRILLQHAAEWCAEAVVCEEVPSSRPTAAPTSATVADSDSRTPVRGQRPVLAAGPEGRRSGLARE
ncbi:MAG: alpha/beta hydrolase [Gammaproteobacteria bacterium]|nr:alpha/beta hydrolase [Gammaproteobacteria bacterium]NIR85740.1 alpha/beta hydrolase [Gammaproteobacteria bacterium]NIR90273.1 alpha/beta hydrolase [Gammaproteobacteria bacterium]NIU06874.1 alpha/beta hydrolase [Gammaproteobacteria bacterium]NIV53807.1 alpha/beta hydrolase [Gammaproteobacteria bacterium]